MTDYDMMGIEDARSPAGHAAYSMRGTDDRWVRIQLNTFMNWANEQLRPKEYSIEDLQTDFCDGIRLCALMEVLRKRKVGRVVKKPLNQHQYLENVTLALTAMKQDNIKLVNIGSEDIVNGNMKLILGMVWHLILRYQIGKSKIPPKKLMLAWLNAVIPEQGITNFNADWNNGIALHALLEYCKPGLSPNWRQLSGRDGLANCQIAMQLAQQHFDIPLILSPENLSSPDLDELSGMTYLSYYMKLDSPGYNATLDWVRKQIPQQNVRNFQRDWNDGVVVAELTQALGGHIAGWPDHVDKNNHEAVIDKAMATASQQLSVTPIISAKEMADPEVDHLGVMAYAAWFRHAHETADAHRGHVAAVAMDETDARPLPLSAPPPPRPETPPPPRKAPEERLGVVVPERKTETNKEVTFRIESLGDDVDRSKVHVEVKGPGTSPQVTLNWHGDVADGKFTPIEAGPHQIVVYNEGTVVQGCPVDIAVLHEATTFHILSAPTSGFIGQACQPITFGWSSPT